MIRKFATIEQASRVAVKHIISLAQEAVLDKGFCTIVMSGGSTPQLTYTLLGEPAYAGQMPWQQSHFFWGDERWVAFTHQDSNYAMIQKAFLSKIHVPLQNIHQIPTGNSSPEAGAKIYETHLRDFFQANPLAEMKNIEEEITVPSFDLALLGMGTDGHTASLFPGSDILEEKKKWVAAVPEGLGSPPVARITLTLPVLNLARNILFLIAGSRKREILDTILTRPEEAKELYPAARIKPSGNLVWLVAEKS